MKTLICRIRRRIYFTGFLGLVAGLALAAFAQTESPPGAAPGPAVKAAVHFSPGIRDVLRMLDAKVDVSVVQAYIKNSPTAYNPSASEIIALKEQGVPDEIVSALIQRGAEVRTQLAMGGQSGGQATAPLTPPGSGAPYAYGGTVPYDYYPDYVNYGYGYPYSSYPYYSYNYGYPYSYWWYNSWYPWGYYSPFYFGYYGHRYHGWYGHYGYPHYYGHSYAHGPYRYGGHYGAWAPARGGFAYRGGYSGHYGSYAGRSFGYAGMRSTGYSGGHMGGFAGPRGGGGFAGHGGGFASHGGGYGGGHGGGGHR